MRGRYPVADTPRAAIPTQRGEAPHRSNAAHRFEWCPRGCVRRSGLQQWRVRRRQGSFCCAHKRPRHLACTWKFSRCVEGGDIRDIFGPLNQFAGCRLTDICVSRSAGNASAFDCEDVNAHGLQQIHACLVKIWIGRKNAPGERVIVVIVGRNSFALDYLASVRTGRFLATLFTSFSGCRSPNRFGIFRFWFGVCAISFPRFGAG